LFSDDGGRFDYALLTTSEDENEWAMHAGGSPLNKVMTEREAMAGEDAEEQRDALRKELSGRYERNVVEDVYLKDGPPPGSSKQYCLVFFKNQVDESYVIIKRKARIVIRGDLQRQGFDFDETFSPTVGSKLIRFTAAFAVEKGYRLTRSDVAQAYLNTDRKIDPEDPLNRVVMYVIPPKCIREGDDHYWIVRGVPYGLKQASRMFYKWMTPKLEAIGFQCVAGEQCLWYKAPDESGRGEVLLAQQVDDHLMAGRDEDVAEVTEKLQEQGVPISIHQEAEKFSGVEVLHSDDGSITLHQRGYVERILRENGYWEAPPRRTPIDVGYRDLYDDNEPLSKKDHAKYRTMVGAAAYASNMTRPDISFAVHALWRHFADPKRQHGRSLIR